MKHHFALLTLGVIAIIGLYLSSGSVYRLSMQDEIDPSALNGSPQIGSVQGIFNNRPVSVPEIGYLASNETPPSVLGVTDQEKRIEVDLTNQKLYAYEGEQRVMEFLISSGKWGRTPTGTFNIWIKLRATKMSGGSKALGTYYYLPNVPYTMYFYNADVPKYQGYGIHGAYWHNNFGHPMSHGCINMRPDDAGTLFNWALPENGGKHTIHASPANPGTKIVIYGTAPTE